MKLMDAPSQKCWACSWIPHMDTPSQKFLACSWMPLMDAPCGYSQVMVVNRNYMMSQTTIRFHQALIARPIKHLTSNQRAVSSKIPPEAKLFQKNGLIFLIIED